MARLILLLLFIGTLSQAQPLAQTNSLVGSWQFSSVFYRGNHMPRPNPDLILIYEFYEDGTDRLHWHRLNEQGFCDRMARYEVNGEHFHELITWVNPKNLSECSSDQDMQLGRMTQVPFRMKNGNLEIDMNLGNETIVYIWERIPDMP